MHHLIIWQILALSQKYWHIMRIFTNEFCFIKSLPYSEVTVLIWFRSESEKLSCKMSTEEASFWSFSFVCQSFLNRLKKKKSSLKQKRSIGRYFKFFPDCCWQGRREVVKSRLGSWANRRVANLDESQLRHLSLATHLDFISIFLTFPEIDILYNISTLYLDSLKYFLHSSYEMYFVWIVWWWIIWCILSPTFVVHNVENIMMHCPALPKVCVTLLIKWQIQTQIRIQIQTPIKRHTS